MSDNPARTRANAVAILRAATSRGRGRRTWACLPGTHNAVKAAANRDAFGVREAGQFVIWWSDFRTTDLGQEEVRRGLWRKFGDRLDQRRRLKAHAHDVISRSRSQ